MLFPVRSVRKITPSKVRYSFLSGAVYALGAVASIYAIQKLGVVLAMLLLLLGPFLRYLSGYFILKENVRKGEMISSVLLAGGRVHTNHQVAGMQLIIVYGQSATGKTTWRPGWPRIWVMMSF